MSNIDELIKQALSEKERDLMQAVPEPGYFNLALGMFRGPIGWVSWLLMGMQIAMFVLGAWLAWRFYTSVDMLEALKWGLSSAVVILGALQVKLSMMPELQANRVLHELKRLELLLLQRKG